MCLAWILAATLSFRWALAEDPRARAERLVAQMTLEEKLGFVQGVPRHSSGHGSYVGIVPGLPRLKIPDLRMNDGPEGFRGDPGTSTQWPSGLTVAHSWDPAMFLAWGTAMGKEFAGKGANVQFGPGANLARLANGGRSFEYSSGEDPYLGFNLIQPVVKGIQSQGVIANAKHVRTPVLPLAVNSAQPTYWFHLLISSVYRQQPGGAQWQRRSAYN